jgi:hypothetical protein
METYPPPDQLFALNNLFFEGLITFVFAVIGASIGSFLTYYFRIRGDINSLISQAKEKKTADVLDGLWKIIQGAISMDRACIHRNFTYPDLNTMDDYDLEQYLDNRAELNKYEKLIIINVQNKNERYNEIILNRDIINADKAIKDLHNYLIYNQLYIPMELFERAMMVSTTLSMSLDSYILGHRLENPKSIKDSRKYLDSIKINLIRDMIKEELHYL